MTTYYRNRETGLVQAHPVSGIGHDLNAVEIGEDGKPMKPYTSLAPSTEELRAAKRLLKDNSASPLDIAASEAVIEQAQKLAEKEAAKEEKAAASVAAKTSAKSEIGNRTASAIGASSPKSTDSKPADGESKQEGGI